MSMHATIHRYEGVAGSTDDIIRAGRQQASALSKLPGFVSYALLEAGDSVLIAISVFETRAEFEAAERLSESWGGDQAVARVPYPPQVTTGEVIVQKGM